MNLPKGCTATMTSMSPKILFLICMATSVAGYGKILEKDLTVLTLNEGQFTTARRTNPIPQLGCRSNCQHAPKTAQCHATGWDGQKQHWRCDAVLPEGVYFGEADVSCEGYSYAGDPYVTIGSCGLSYTLSGKNAAGGRDASLSGKMPLILIGVVFGFLALKWCCSESHDGYDHRSAGDDDSYRRDHHSGAQYPRGPGNGPGFRPDFYSSDGSCSAGGNAARGQSGFWTGLAAGGLAGYLFGRNNTDAYGYGGNYDYLRPRYQSAYQSSSEHTAGPSRSTSAYASTSRR